MKKLLLILPGLIALSPIASGNSGSSVRGGGKVAVCRDAAGNIESVELLDLWEARVLRKRTVQYSDAPVEEQVRAAIGKLKARITSFDPPEFLDLVEKVNRTGLEQAANAFFNKTPRYNTAIERLRDVNLSWTEDGFEVASPSNCKLEQVAAMGSDALYINEDLFEKMNPTNQAALIVHEMIYSMGVYHGMKTPSSLRSRRVVGHIFSGGDFSTRPPFHLPHYSCEGAKGKPRTEFGLYNDPQDGTLMGAIFDGFEEKFVGFFPRKVRDMTEASTSLETIISEKQCEGQPENELFHVAQIGASGPVDFDRHATLFGRCDRGSFQLFFSTSWDEKDLASAVPVTCTWNPGK